MASSAAAVSAATRSGSGARPPSKAAAAPSTAGSTAHAAASSVANGTVATAGAAAPHSSERAIDHSLVAGVPAMFEAPSDFPATDEIERRMQTLEAALCCVLWPAKPQPAAAAAAADAFDPRAFVRPSRKRQPAPARAAAPPQPMQAAASSVAAAVSTAATPAPAASPASLATAAQRDREESSIIAAIRSNNPAPLRALIAEVASLRSLGQSSTAAHAGPLHVKHPIDSSPLAISAGAVTPTHAHHSSMPSALSSIGADGVAPAAPPRLNGLALLKAKAKAKALEAAEAALQQHQHQQQATATQMHRDEEKASMGDARILEERQPPSHMGRPRDRSAAGAAASSTAAADHSRSPSGDRALRPSRHGSFKRRRRRKKRQQNLEGGPYRSRFDEHGALLPGYASAASGGQTTEDEESAPLSLSASHSTLHSPEHAAVLAKASAHVSSLKKKNKHRRAASVSDASDNETKRAFETQPKAVTGPFSSKQQQQSHAKDPAPVFVTAPLLHSTQSSLPQLPHHLLNRKQQPHSQQHPQQQQQPPPPHLVSSRASLLRAPHNFPSAHPHSAALASHQAGLDPMAPNPAVAARLAGLRGGGQSAIPHATAAGGASSWASSGMALPSQARGGGAASAASGADHRASAAAAARNFSPSRLQVSFDHSKHRSVPNSIEKPGGSSAAGHRAPVYAFHG